MGGITTFAGEALDMIHAAEPVASGRALVMEAEAARTWRSPALRRSTNAPRVIRVGFVMSAVGPLRPSIGHLDAGALP